MHVADGPVHESRPACGSPGPAWRITLAAMRQHATRTHLAPGLELLELVVLGQATEGRAGAHAPRLAEAARLRVQDWIMTGSGSSQQLISCCERSGTSST